MKTIKEYLESIQICEFKESIFDKIGNDSGDIKGCNKAAKLFIYNSFDSDCLLFLCRKHFHIMFCDNFSQGCTYNKYNHRLNKHIYIYFNSHTNSEFNVLTLEEFKKVSLLQ